MQRAKSCFQRYLMRGAEKHTLFPLKSTTYYILLENIDTYTMFFFLLKITHFYTHTFRKYRYIYHVLFFLLKSTSYSWAFRSAQRASRRVSCARTHKSLVLTFSELLWIKHEPESVKNQN